MTDSRKIVLVYDGKCPACSNYAKTMRIESTVGELELVNAREDAEIMDEIAARGFNIDHGMVVKIDDEFYSGADAIHAFALLGSRSGILNRLNYWLFKSRARSKFLFPILRFSRNLLLLLLGRKRIEGDGFRLHEAGEGEVAAKSTGSAKSEDPQE